MGVDEEELRSNGMDRGGEGRGGDGQVGPCQRTEPEACVKCWFARPACYPDRAIHPFREHLRRGTPRMTRKQWGGHIGRQSKAGREALELKRVTPRKKRKRIGIG